MVDVGGKNVTNRTAVAQASVVFPEEVWMKLSQNEFVSKKGSVFQTAIIAGILGLKKTSDLIPLCHPLMISKADIQIERDEKDFSLHVQCTVALDGKTGVEMEALTGASIAALTIYDMCKALSHEIKIQEVKLVSKTGGKSDYTHVL